MKLQPVNEGTPYLFADTFKGNIPLADAAQALSGVGTLGKHKVILGYESTITADKNCELYATVKVDPANVMPALAADVLLNAGASIGYKFNGPVHSAAIDFGLRGDGAGTVAVRIGLTASGVVVTNDLNYDADNKLLFVGDSITDYTVNSDVELHQYYGFVLRDALAKGSRSKRTARNIVKGIAGKTSVDFDKLLKAGQLYVDEPAIVFYGHGVEDQKQAVTVAAYGAAIESFINYKKQYWPNAVLVIQGATPVQSATRQTALDAYRTEAAARVTAAADPRVLYINLAAAFDNTVAARFATVDGIGGDAVHPGDAIAQKGIADALLAGLTAAGIAI